MSTSHNMSSKMINERYLFQNVKIITIIFNSLLKSGVTLRQRYQFVRPEKNTKFTRGTTTLILKEKNYKIRAEFGIRWGPLARSPLNRARYIEIADFFFYCRFCGFCTKFPRFHQ
jgi:hypothetical protein